MRPSPRAEPTVSLLLSAIVFVSFLHLFLQVYNRRLLCITDGPIKGPLIVGSFVLLVLLPAGALLALNASQGLQDWLSDAVQGTARHAAIVGLVAVVALFFARASLWLLERAFPERPDRLLSEVSRPQRVPHVPSPLPRTLRFLDTTSDLELCERELALPGLSPEFDGLTIAQVSDIHFEQRIERENYLSAVLQVVNGLEADVVVLTGDFVNRRRDIVRSVAFHARFRARLGIYAVLGNHDYWTSPQRVREALGGTSIRWLGNGDRRVFKRQGRRLVFTGTDAPWDGTVPDYDRLIRRGTGDAVVLLSHTPDNAPAAARAGASLILSGHNHGGQICFPLLGPVVVPSRYGLRYAGGLYRVGGDALLNVSRGVGVSTGGVRILCPPEICLLRLRARESEVMVGRLRRERMLRQEEPESSLIPL